MEGKKVLVTSGGTTEYIDDVRVMTNISSGKLGSMIADKLHSKGADVFYLCGKMSVLPSCPVHMIQIKSAMDAMKEMEKLVPNMDAVVHSMAVSDFTFRRDQNIKCKSNDPEGFIEYMRQTITPNPKIISKIKKWNPSTILVGFKFEVGKTREELKDLALKSIKSNGCDLVITNDKKEMETLKVHAAYPVFSKKIRGLLDNDDILRNYPYFEDLYRYMGKDQIAYHLTDFIGWALKNACS